MAGTGCIRHYVVTPHRGSVTEFLIAKRAKI
jgi:hypothetical protein